MQGIYDNGYILLGTKKDIVNYWNNCISEEDKKEVKEIIEDIQECSDNTILAINYDNGMGYSIDYWEENDLLN